MPYPLDAANITRTRWFKSLFPNLGGTAIGRFPFDLTTGTDDALLLSLAPERHGRLDTTWARSPYPS